MISLMIIGNPKVKNILISALGLRLVYIISEMINGIRNEYVNSVESALFPSLIVITVIAAILKTNRIPKVGLGALLFLDLLKITLRTITYGSVMGIDGLSWDTEIVMSLIAEVSPLVLFWAFLLFFFLYAKRHRAFERPLVETGS